MSHRSGETEDTFIADLVVGLCTGQVLLAVCKFCWGPQPPAQVECYHRLLPRGQIQSLLSSLVPPLESLFPPQIKTGAPCRSERLAKYNQLMRYSGGSGHGHEALRALGLEGHSSDSVCFLGLRRRSGTRLSLLDANSVIQRPNEKLEVPGPHKTDLGLQALLPEIKAGANQDSAVLLCGREGMLVWLVRQDVGQEREHDYNLLGRGGRERLVRGEVGLDLQQSSHFRRRLGEAGATCEMKQETLMEHGTSSWT